MTLPERWQGHPDGRPAMGPVSGCAPDGLWLLSAQYLQTPFTST
jgi:hypothetical protein